MPAAVARLGLNNVRSVCLVLAVVKAFGKRSVHIDHNHFWAHSATVAALASRLWSRVGHSTEVTAEDAYVVGPLHDVGLLIIDQHFPEEFASLLALRGDDTGPLALVEEEQFGSDPSQPSEQCASRVSRAGDGARRRSGDVLGNGYRSCCRGAPP